jgi:hypothetical protein
MVSIGNDAPGNRLGRSFFTLNRPRCIAFRPLIAGMMLGSPVPIVAMDTLSGFSVC